MSLTPKRERFVQELIKGKSQRVAYRIAYPSSKKWKDNVVDSKASNLLKDGKVRARYDEIRGKVVKRAEDKAIITAEEIIQGITDIAKDDISNYLEFGTEKVVVGYDDSGNPLTDYRTVV